MATSHTSRILIGIPVKNTSKLNRTTIVVCWVVVCYYLRILTVRVYFEVRARHKRFWASYILACVESTKIYIYIFPFTSIILYNLVYYWGIYYTVLQCLKWRKNSRVFNNINSFIELSILYINIINYLRNRFYILTHFYA